MGRSSGLDLRRKLARTPLQDKVARVWHIQEAGSNLGAKLEFGFEVNSLSSFSSRKVLKSRQVRH